VLFHILYYRFCRFSDKAELFMPNSPKWAAGEPFLHKAKVGCLLINSICYKHTKFPQLSVVNQISWPTLDALHTLILIAWAEYGSARDSGLFNFARMASSMLVDLGISSQESIDRVEDVQERELLKLSWSGVVRIELTSAWGTVFSYHCASFLMTNFRSDGSVGVVADFSVTE
jgi:hypothetical protein